MEENATKTRLRRLLDPVFLLALAALLLNDHVLKAVFHNFWTGKLSDFAGLFAFAWVGMSLLPRRARRVGWMLAIAFACWKSPLATPLLAFWNAAGILPLQRVLDYGDWAALLVLPFAAWRFAMLRVASAPNRSFAPLAQGFVLCLALFAFCATSYKNDFDFSSKYELSIPPQEVLHRLDSLSKAKNLPNPSLSLHHANANEFRQEGQQRLYLHHNDNTDTYCDTIYAEKDDSVYIDEIREYERPMIDSMYVNPEGYFGYTFELRPATEPGKNLAQCQTIEALLRLEILGAGSRLQLVHIETLNCDALPANENKIGPEEYLQQRFEEEVVGVLKGAER